MKKYTITVNGTAYEVEVEEAGVVASAPKAAPKAAPAPIAKVTKKPEGKSTPKKASPLHEEKAVTVEWDFNGKKDSISSDRDRILSELEQKAKDKKTQTKMDF